MGGYKINKNNNDTHNFVSLFFKRLILKHLHVVVQTEGVSNVLFIHLITNTIYIKMIHKVYHRFVALF